MPTVVHHPSAGEPTGTGQGTASELRRDSEKTAGVQSSRMISSLRDSYMDTERGQPMAKMYDTTPRGPHNDSVKKSLPTVKSSRQLEPTSSFESLNKLKQRYQPTAGEPNLAAQSRKAIRHLDAIERNVAMSTDLNHLIK